MKTVLSQDFTRHPLMQKYRVFREGILVLPHLESHLIQELAVLLGQGLHETVAEFTQQVWPP